MRVFVLWILDITSGITAFLGAILVGWNSLEVYYLVTGRVIPDFEQPSLAVVVPLLFLGVILMLGGYVLHRQLRKDNP